MPQLWRGGAVVGLDSLGAHKVKGVRELLEAAGARLLYLPPYSRPTSTPYRDGLEQTKKNFLRKVAARTSAALDCAIAEGLHAVSAQDAHGFFKHCGYLS